MKKHRNCTLAIRQVRKKHRICDQSDSLLEDDLRATRRHLRAEEGVNRSMWLQKHSWSLKSSRLPIHSSHNFFTPSIFYNVLSSSVQFLPRSGRLLAGSRTTETQGQASTDLYLLIASPLEPQSYPELLLPDFWSSLGATSLARVYD